MSSADEFVYFKKLSEAAKIPTKASEGAAGYDIFCVKGFEINSNEQKIIFIDLAIEIPNNKCYIRLAPKSSLSLDNIIINAGIIDSDYRGNIGVMMYNFGPKNIVIERGTAIAQIIFEKISHPVFLEMESLSETDRNEQGFGDCTFSQKINFDDCKEILSDSDTEDYNITKKVVFEDEITVSEKKEDTVSEKKENFGTHNDHNYL
ncbi:deoxyuridine 5'-triphosphate nucleotidohydrolase-like [Centruroides vittatus]|uniref:deoxyuridine 5'-triphosphate nucleotidohydrolase-like n=1 Tax=Centruroides vittatus TaxID=120091 RepID=UPI00350F5002